jgi:vacuolar-type H+-ATPase subunit I/STV1
MTRRRPRDLEAERVALRTATDRLLAGTPLRSASGKLTASELLRESGLRRDVAYGDHKDLVEEFQARVKAQNATPEAMQELADKYSAMKEKLVAVTENLTKEQVVSATLRRIVAELDLELTQAREELEQSGNVASLPAPRRRAARR